MSVPPRVFHMMQCISALSIQAKTGMVHSRGSVIKLCQRMYGVKGRTAAKALEEMKEIYRNETGKEYGQAGD